MLIALLEAIVRSILLINTPVDHNIICFNIMKQIATHRFHQRLAR